MNMQRLIQAQQCLCDKIIEIFPNFCSRPIVKSTKGAASAALEHLQNYFDAYKLNYRKIYFSNNDCYLDRRLALYNFTKIECLYFEVKGQIEDFISELDHKYINKL